jgi:GWxTD domain-containing protein
VVNADTLIPLLGGFLIDELPTGNYRLTVCAIMGKQIIAHRVFSFTRTNKIMITNATSTSNFTTNMKKDSLVKYIHCLLPLAKVNDVDYVSSDSLGNLSRAELQSFFYGFWAARNPNDPRGEWDRYYQRVNEVQAEFGTNQLKGYQTDRGRIYLQNGPPNQRFSSNISPTSYPYEIWEYYRLADGQIDRKYVFYEPDVVTNNYVLLQSNAKGEVHNQQWQLMLNDRFGGANNVDQTNNPDAYGENALDEYNSPR